MTRRVETVLLVDDNEADNFIHELAIRQSGLARSTVVFTNASAALDYLRDADTAPDLAFIDVNMPEMDGWQFMRRYAEIEHLRDKGSEMVMLTTSRDPKDRERADRNPVIDGFVTKPLTTELFAKLAGRRSDRDRG